MSEHMSVMLRCPACGAIMEEGFVPVSQGMSWVKGRDPKRMDFREGLPGTHAVMRPNRLEGWRCRRCHLITVRYGKPIEHRREYQRQIESVEGDADASVV